MIDTPLARHWFMHTSHTAVGIGTTAKVGFRQTAPYQRPEPLPQVRTLRVGLVTGAEEMWEPAADLLAEHLLRDPGLEIDRAWDCIDLGIDITADYDCLVLLGWPTASRRKLLKRIELHCRGGGSLVALRAIHAELPGWTNFAEEVLGGRQLPGTKCRLLEVERSDSAWHHPIVAGLETMIAEGEVYCGPRFSPDTSVLLKTHSAMPNGQRGLPVAWAKRQEGGRVFCTTLGLLDDFRIPGFVRLISNAVHWVGLVQKN